MGNHCCRLKKKDKYLEPEQRANDLKEKSEKEEKKNNIKANEKATLAVNCLELIDEIVENPEENIHKIYKIPSTLAQINVIVLVLLQYTCIEDNSKNQKKECQSLLNFLQTIFENIKPWKKDENKRYFYKKVLSEMLTIFDEYYPEIQNANDPIILSLIQETYFEANMTYATLRNLPDYSAGKSKLDWMKSYLDKLRVKIQGTLNRIGIEDNVDRNKGLPKLHAKYLKELLEALNANSNEELIFESIRNCRFDKRKFHQLSHSLIMGSDGGIYVLLNKVSSEEYELLSECPDLNSSLDLIIDEHTRKIIIGKGSFGKIRIVMAIIPNEKKNNSLIEGKLVCVKKAGKNNKGKQEIWSSTWNDYCSIEFLDDAPEIYDIKINKDSQNKLQGYCFQKLLMFPNGQKIFEDSKEENIKKFTEYHNWSHIKNYVMGIFTLMIELHSKGICMTDLKPANTLYDKESKTTKLVDLAGAVKVKNKEELKSFKIGSISEYTIKYTAPDLIEEIENDNNDYKIDLTKCISWTIGKIIYELKIRIPELEMKILENDLKKLINDLQEERIPLEEGLKRLEKISVMDHEEYAKKNILSSYVDLLKAGFAQEDRIIQRKLNLKNDIYDLCRVFNNKLKITAYNPDKYENYVYDPENDKTIQNLTEGLKCMLNQRNEVEIFDKEYNKNIKKEALILFGSAGSGKSSTLQKLFIDAVKEWKPNDPIPIFMNLAIDQDLRNYISRLMSSLGIVNYQFESILTAPVNLFLDSLDESRIKDARYIQTLFQELSSYKNKNSIRMIVTCRTGYFDEDCLEKEIRNDEIKVQLRYIIPLDFFFFNDNSDLTELIELYLAKNRERIEEVDKIKEKLNQYLETIKEYDLNKLMKTTYMIFIILNILPELEKKRTSHQSIENDSINLLTIYRMYLINNISKEIKRSSIEVIKKKSVDFLMKIGTTLAEKMMETEKATNQLKGKDVFNFLMSPALTQLLGKKYRAELGFIENKEIYEIMRTLNLNIHIEGKNENEEITLSFPHDNIKNFFAVDGLVNRIRNSDVYPEWLERKLFVKEENLIIFIIEAFKNNFQLAQKGEVAILATKNQTPDSKVSVRAANIITFLVASNYSFYGRDLSHIKIKGADISDGIFNACNFDYADLSEVRLNNVKFDRASFYKTNLSKAKIDNFLPLCGHSDRVYSVAYCADGKRIVSGSCDKSVRIWDAENGKELKNIEGHSEYVSSVDFSADGKRIVSGSWDKIIKIWDVETGKELKKYEGHSNYINSVAFSADGKRIVSGSYDKTVRIWDVENGKELTKFEGHSDGVKSVAFSADGKKIVSGSRDNTLRIWDVETEKELKKYEGHTESVNSVAFSPDGKKIVSGSNDETIRIWELETEKEGKKFPGHADYVTSVAFSADGKRIVSGSGDKTVRIWDVETGKELKKYDRHSIEVTSVAFSADGKRIVSGSCDKSVRIWNVEAPKEIKKYEGHSNGISSVAFCVGGKSIVTGSWDNTIRIWNIENGKELKKYDGHSECVTSIALSADGKNIVSGSGDTTVRIWDTETGKELKKCEGHTRSVNSVAFSADGKKIVSGSVDETVRIWNVETGKEVKKYEGHSNFVTSVSFSADGKKIVSSCNNSFIVWDTETGKIFKKYKGHSDLVTSVAFSADGKRIASSSFDKTVRIWDLETGEELKKCEGHSDRVHSVVFSTDGTIIVTGSSDNTVRIWNVETEKELKKYEGHSDPVNSVAISVDGKKIISGSWDRTVRFWDVETGKDLKKYGGQPNKVISVANPSDKKMTSANNDANLSVLPLENKQTCLIISCYSTDFSSLNISNYGTWLNCPDRLHLFFEHFKRKN